MFSSSKNLSRLARASARSTTSSHKILSLLQSWTACARTTPSHNRHRSPSRRRSERAAELFIARDAFAARYIRRRTEPAGCCWLRVGADSSKCTAQVAHLRIWLSITVLSVSVIVTPASSGSTSGVETQAARVQSRPSYGAKGRGLSGRCHP